MRPDTTVKIAEHVATSASNILNRVSTLVNFGCGKEEQRKQFIEKLQGEYINKETGFLNKEGRSYLNSLYGNNKEFRDEIKNFVRDKKELDLEEILDRRYETNKLNTTGREYLARCILSKDNAKILIQILAKFADQ